MTDSLQKKLSKLKEDKPKLGEWIRQNSDAKTMGELLRRFIEVQEEAVRDIASSIENDIDKTNRFFHDMKSTSIRFSGKASGFWEGYLEAKEEDKKLLVGSSPLEVKEKST